MNNTLQEVNDDVLMSSLANGDSKAIQHIYKSCYPIIEKMVYKMNGSMDDAYDVFQDSMTILYEKAKANNLNLSCKLSTYLTAIAKHLWLKKLSEKKRQPFAVLYDGMDDQQDLAQEVQHFFEFENHVSKLSQCFEKIGEPCNGLLKAFYLQNKSMQVIAEEFGYTNPDNAKTQKYKCLNRLRKLFFSEPETVKTNERIF
ncbi:MAG: sigma-70 family RNA polymerase sigma factor [Chitinophagaceae bacterium]|nr:sigma-70 family RNA polymerase sigma factor [Chitinophagaceae bacterium]